MCHRTPIVNEALQVYLHLMSFALQMVMYRVIAREQQVETGGQLRLLRRILP
jgi:hypothetical protein